MYPNNKYPSYGIFVKKTEDLLIEEGFAVDKIVMYKTNNKLLKFLYYTLHYVRIIIKLLLTNTKTIYVHYASHNALPILIAKSIRRNLNIYTNVHGSDVIPETKVQKRLQKLVKKLLKSSKLIIVPSVYFKEVVQEKYRLTNKIEVSPSGGIDRKIFKPLNIKPSKIGLDDNKTYIGYVGRIEYEKGWDDLIIAFESITKEDTYKNVSLIIVGNGREYLNMREMILQKNLEERIVLLDFMPHDKLCKVYNIIDVLIFPTRRKGESLGLVGLEAMSCGTPVIGSNIGGLKSYINHKQNGLLFQPGDRESLMKSIIEFLNYSPKQKQGMCYEAIQTAMQYDKDLIKKNLASLFK
jgi:glycosyltransferase involved in cell wall biosynthesis